MIRYENEYEYDHKNTILYQTLSVRVSMFVRDKRSMMKYYEKYLVKSEKDEGRRKRGGLYELCELNTYDVVQKLYSYLNRNNVLLCPSNCLSFIQFNPTVSSTE